ncbi:transposase [Streptomyces uncialis]|uniref:transposase n=1 Tax=Streptomyces uncialis TaxID=1048205 RepID=UPI00093F46EF
MDIPELGEKAERHLPVLAPDVLANIPIVTPFSMVFTEAFDAKVMCRFLAWLVGHFDHKVHTIVDRHSARRSKTIRTCSPTAKTGVELHLAPSYSLELNPDKIVNADLKRSLPRAYQAPESDLNSPPEPAGSSTVDNGNPTSCTDTSAVGTSGTSSMSDLHEFLINMTRDQ